VTADGAVENVLRRTDLPRTTPPGGYRMHAGIPSLGPAHMQAPGGQVDVVPSQCRHLLRSDAVAVGNQDGRGITMPGAVLLRGLNKPLNLSLGEIFAAASANCYIYCGWSPLAKPCVFPCK
jgi:hypothetical protein